MKPGILLTLALLIGSFLIAQGVNAAPCTPSDNVLCLSAERFSVEVHWRDFQNNTGTGRAARLTPDTGYFWFFSDSNVELVVKVLDARSFNAHFWVFFGALSNVEYTLTVTDTVTGATKTYQNPAGRFASVGDTAAFTGAATGPVPSSESVTAEGTGTPPESVEAIRRFVDAAASDAAPETRTMKATTFTPCPGPSTSLFLSNCRFEVTAEWKDFQGGTGSGQAVQLSPDTGYFWFFSPSNVELIVKVLDARSFNDRLWVFYGALSNVEYSLHVKDRVSGALRIYRNPSGNFASVGDTSAFRGGYGVAVSPDSGRAVSGEITVAGGGTLSATAANGTVFTLEVPPNALLTDKTITMTPVTAIDRLPFSGGLVAAVDLQPSGLSLMDAARLTIRTPSPLPQAEETPFAWNGSGEDFFLYPPVAANGDLQMYVFHLGGYGVGRGTDNERLTQAGREPVGEDDRLSHQMAPLLREGRAEARSGTAAVLPQAPSGDWRLGMKLLLDQSYSELQYRMENSSGDPTDVIELVREVITWERTVVQNLGSLEAAFPGRHAQIRALLENLFNRALETIHERCVADVAQIRELPRILGVAKILGFNLQGAEVAALRCLNFQLKFDSTIVSSEAVTITYTVSATVPLTFHLRDSSDPSFILGSIDGEGNVSVDKIDISSANPLCHWTPDLLGASTFRAKLYPFLDLEKWSHPTGLILRYDPGDPPSTVKLTCETPDGSDTSDPIVIQEYWRVQYANFHSGDVSSVSGYFLASDWTPTGSKDPWAIKGYSRPGPSGSIETTFLKLSHTPQ